MNCGRKDAVTPVYMMVKKGKAGPYILIIISILIILSAFAYFITYANEEPKNIKNLGSIEIYRMEVVPDKLKTGENGTLTLGIKNICEDKITLQILFETHKNVQIYIGKKSLSKIGGNYTYTMSLDPDQKTEIAFKVNAILDIGDYERTYYIKAYIYVNGIYKNWTETTFKVSRA